MSHTKDYDRIYLEPGEHPGSPIRRCWSHRDVGASKGEPWGEYVRADLVDTGRVQWPSDKIAALTAEVTRLREAIESNAKATRDLQAVYISTRTERDRYRRAMAEAIAIADRVPEFGSGSTPQELCDALTNISDTLLEAFRELSDHEEKYVLANFPTEKIMLTRGTLAGRKMSENNNSTADRDRYREELRNICLLSGQGMVGAPDNKIIRKIYRTARDALTPPSVEDGDS